MIEEPNNLLSLMYAPVSNSKIINTLEVLGLAQPQITEESQEEGKISTSNKDIAFVFREISGLSKDGDPVLTKIDFINYNFVKFPFDLLPSDDYMMCCVKLDKKADFVNKRRLKESKIWVKSIQNIETSIVVHFKDTTFQKINYIIVNKFDSTRINKNLIPNKD